tara:strand:- start:30 stop:989 length:960 start_codon:yes stop_codon:yes gene_type:complete
MAKKRKDNLGTPQLGGALDIKMNEMAGVRGFGGGSTGGKGFFRKSVKSKERKAKEKQLTADYTKSVQAHVQKGKDLKITREKFGSAMNEATYKVASSNPKIAAEGKNTLDKSFSNRSKLAKLRVTQSKNQPGGHKAPRPLDLWDSTKGSKIKKKVLIKVAKDEGILAKPTLPKNSRRSSPEPRPARPDVVPSGLEGLQNTSKRLTTKPTNYSVKNPANKDLYKEVPSYPSMDRVLKDIDKYNKDATLKREAGEAWRNLKLATPKELSLAHAAKPPKVKAPPVDREAIRKEARQTAALTYKKMPKVERRKKWKLSKELPF